MRLPIFDNHVHLHPNGRHVEAARDFAKAGGTHLVLSHLPYEMAPVTEARHFADSYKITLDLAELVRKSVDIGVEVTVGPYPVLLIGLAERHGLEGAVDIMRTGMEEAQRLVLQGKAIGIGEIGRPHFPVPEDVLMASNEIMSYGMSLAREAVCPVVLHTESATPENMREIALMADHVGLPRNKVVKHYCPPLVTDEENSGLFPSVLASRTAIGEALAKGTRFMMETDYLDDLRRPGAVMAITTVPKRTKALLQSGGMSEEQAHVIHADNPEKVYGIEVRS
ncbi:MAG: TatD family hydrolase [Methanomassiliicoccales archaeon]|jgi:TatD-related deoxyribonuclease|nr:TatD family hydrolase [Methanomassiliicoccales archaeon]MDD1756790.1 TatD family hydrolase [Methanomassiliicoccales archaeon]